MNLQLQIRRGSTPRPVKLTVDQFRHLKKAGAFSGYGKSELLDGAISGVPRSDDGALESNAAVPIKLRVQDYLLLDEAGMLAGSNKTELVDGILYEMSPQHRPHWYAKNELTYRLRRALEELESPLYVGSEGSVRMSDVDLPEPDTVVTSEPFGTGSIPVASVRLLVEIADSTRSYDLGTKAALYAAAGVPEYWVLDIVDKTVHQMWAPTDGAYAKQHEVPFGKAVAAATIERLVVETTGL